MRKYSLYTIKKQHVLEQTYTKLIKMVSKQIRAKKNNLIKTNISARKTNTLQ